MRGVFVVLLQLRRRRQFDGEVTLAYTLLYAIARFVLEFFRGDADRGFVFGGFLSTCSSSPCFSDLSRSCRGWSAGSGLECANTTRSAGLAPVLTQFNQQLSPVRKPSPCCQKSRRRRIAEWASIRSGSVDRPAAVADVRIDVCHIMRGEAPT